MCFVSLSDQPEHVKTHCEHHRDSVKTTSADGYPIVGAYVPQCDAEGQYLSQQCHGSTGYCWCVDSRGEERAGTRTPPGAAPVDCDRPDERLKTHCEHYRDSVKATSPDGNPITGVYVPQCDAEGQYLPQQCHGSTGYCWCVDSRGEERAGTRTPPGAAPVDCDRPDQPEHVKTHCEHHRDSVKTTSADGYPIVGAYVPQCDAEGQYLSQQCHGSTGYCWCVDSRGEERAGTRTPPGAAPVDCDRPDQPEHVKTHCEHHRDSVKTTSADGYPIVGAYVPQCDAEGQYLSQQCHGSTGYL
ncbi:equistatin-like [Haplochromis burtoni]|uniref:equistatin-like n=1 Tax=Haplochromis burtoni TaxID=8153 RepID=UPI001C2D3CB0|nr:equistatin-like [Haplochromis burtoni]